MQGQADSRALLSVGQTVSLPFGWADGETRKESQ